ncbi:MAG: hydroxyacid dehydrogenase [Saprospiraceae bacterium]|nr:hydroxyacid dehydrogenase [Saprospiraceae bacterium]
MKILITDKVHPLLIEGLQHLGHEVVYNTTVTIDTLPDHLAKLDGIIINSKILMDQKMIDLGGKLRFIARLGSGMEIIDVPYAKSKGIKVINTPDGNCDAVAEHAIGMMLAFANNLIKANAEVKDFDWRREENRGFELGGKTIGIIGMGHTGSALARKLRGFEMNILGVDKYKNKEDYFEGCDHVVSSSLDVVLQKADIISFHLPLSRETKHYADSSFFAQTLQKPLIVNTSRGNVIHTSELLKALEQKTIKGACLDVFENEKPKSFSKEEKNLYSKLYALENTILSPHIAGWTHESLEKIARLTLNRIQKALT